MEGFWDGLGFALALFALFAGVALLTWVENRGGRDDA